MLGLAFAWAAVAALRGAIPVALPAWVELGVDWRAVGYTAALSLAVSLLFGLAPMLTLARADLTAALREGQPAGGGRSRRRLRSSLVVLEIALALVLLVGARLMVGSFLRLRQVDPGFRPAGVLVAEVNLTYRVGGGSSRERYSALVQRALARLGELPGVAAAAADSNPPLAPQDVWDRQLVTVFGQSPAEQRANPVVNFQAVSPDYFRTMGIGQLRGRVFDAGDVVGRPRVALVGQEAARRLWPGADPVGRRVKIGPPAAASPWLTVVGVVRDVSQQSLAGGVGCDLFVPIFQAPRKRFTVLVRPVGPVRGLARAVRAALAGTSAEIGVGRMTTLQEIVAGSIWVPRLWGWLFGVFSGLSLLLAAGGIYGVTAASVKERTREIGVRMALGARRRGVLLLLLGQGLALALIGAALGLGLAAILGRLLAGLLFQVDAGEPRVFAEVAGVLGAVVMAASWVGSRGASRVEPVIALRGE